MNHADKARFDSLQRQYDQLQREIVVAQGEYRRWLIQQAFSINEELIQMIVRDPADAGRSSADATRPSPPQ